MIQPRKRFPPLEPLIAFEAAARLESFTAAGQELCLSQAAISKQIRLLEENLGHELFSRAKRRVRLTPKGSEFLHVVTHALSQISAASMEMRAPSESEVANISIGHACAHLWLGRKLSSFFDAYPGARLEISCLTEQRTPSAKADLTIMAGDGSWPGFESRPLIREYSFPVCSPRFLLEFGGSLDFSSFQRVTFLDLDDEQPECMTWRIWLSSNGFANPKPDCRLKVNSYPLLVEAARAGLGVALGWGQLVRPYLEDGTLVRCMPHSIASEIGYYVLWSPEAERNFTTESFLGWLMANREEWYGDRP